MRIPRASLPFLVISLRTILLAPSGRAGEKPGRLVASGGPAEPAEPGWPQFRGPGRDGVSDETGLMHSWPEGGPPLLWKASGLGRGYSSAVVTRGAVYVTGDVGDDLVVYAFDLDGRPKWRTTNGRAWKGAYPGARASVTVDGDRLFHMNAHGRAVALDAADGGELWAVDVLGRFQASNIKWGISECLLVDRVDRVNRVDRPDGGRVIVTPGGKRALMAALDRRTGDTVWATEPLRFTRTRRFGGDEVRPSVSDTDKAGYASPILFELGELGELGEPGELEELEESGELGDGPGSRRLIAGCSARHFFCVDAEAGGLLWTHEVPARWEVIGAIPVLWRDAVFFTAPDVCGKLFRVRADRDGVRLDEVWRTPLDNCHGALVVAGDRLYGSGYRSFDGWAALDAATGKTLYTKRDLANGSVIRADGRLYALSEAGAMALLEPAREGFRTAGGFRLPARPAGRRRRRDAWAHPAICDGRLYLRYHDVLYCYDIRRRDARAEEPPRAPGRSR